MLLLIPLLATVVVVVAMVGFRLLRSTGLEGVESGLLDVDDRMDRQSRLAAFIDAVGVRFQRSLLQLYGPRRIINLERRLDVAGHPEGLTAMDYVRRQAGFAVIGATAAIFFVLAGQVFIGVVCLALFGFWMDLWLRLVGSRRQQAIARDVPDMLDILAVTVSAGVSLQPALARVAEATAGPLGEEIDRVLDDMRLGMSRRRAFAALKERNTAPSIVSWVSAMQQSEELGTPLSGALTDIAAEVRRERAQEVRRIAAKAGPKVSLVVTLFIIPAALMLILSSFIISQIDTVKGLL